MDLFPFSTVEIPYDFSPSYSPSHFPFTYLFFHSYLFSCVTISLFLSLPPSSHTCTLSSSPSFLLFTFLRVFLTSPYHPTAPSLFFNLPSLPLHHVITFPSPSHSSPSSLSLPHKQCNHTPLLQPTLLLPLPVTFLPLHPFLRCLT